MLQWRAMFDEAKAILLTLIEEIRKLRAELELHRKTHG